jgi:hypothetical protein
MNEKLQAEKCKLLAELKELEEQIEKAEAIQAGLSFVYLQRPLEG